MKKIKVGYFTHTNISPSETFIYDLVKGLNEDNDFQLTYISGQIEPLKIDFNLNYINSGFFEKNKKLSSIAFRFGQIIGNKGYRFRRYIQRNIAKRALNKLKLPIFDVAYVEYATNADLLINYFEENKIPFIVHTHGYDITSARHDVGYSINLNKLFRSADKIITPSKHLKRYLFLLGTDNKKIEVIYPFSMDYKIKYESLLNRYNNPPTITFLGRLTEKKNPIALIRAFEIILKKIPNAKLNILGGGKFFEDCICLAKKINIYKSINFYGVVNRKVAFEVFNKSWICAQHSITTLHGDQEGFPVSLAEAAAHSLPIVSTIHSGITENIIDGETGFLVQEYDYLSMADRIIYLIKNPDLAIKMGNKARKNIQKLCPPEKRIKKIKSLIEEAYLK